MLAWLCQDLIKAYWFFIPKEKRIACLYKDHCSQHVFNSFDKGFVCGVKAFIKRFRNCNNRYTYFIESDVIKIKTVTGEIIPESEISDLVAKGCRATLYK